MKKIDIYLQNVRISKAARFIQQGDHVIDIGTYDGVLFERLGGLIGKGVGIDPRLPAVVTKKNYTLIPGYFPEACTPGEQYDAITMLAVLEHIPLDMQLKLAEGCERFLKKGGRVIITVPSPQVDIILEILTGLKIIDGMVIHEHYGFKPKDTLKIFERFKLLHRSTFQFGLNNLFVFEKI